MTLEQGNSFLNNISNGLTTATVDAEVQQITKNELFDDKSRHNISHDGRISKTARSDNN